MPIHGIFRALHQPASRHFSSTGHRLEQSLAVVTHHLGNFGRDGLSRELLMELDEFRPLLQHVQKDVDQGVGRRGAAARVLRMMSAFSSQFALGNLQERIPRESRNLRDIWAPGFLHRIDSELNVFLGKNEALAALLDDSARAYLQVASPQEAQSGGGLVKTRLTLDGARAVYMNSGARDNASEIQLLAQRADMYCMPALLRPMQPCITAWRDALEVLSGNGHLVSGNFYKGLRSGEETDDLLHRLLNGELVWDGAFQRCGSQRFHSGMKHGYEHVLVFSGNGVDVSAWGRKTHIPSQDQYEEYVITGMSGFCLDSMELRDVMAFSQHRLWPMPRTFYRCEGVFAPS